MTTTRTDLRFLARMAGMVAFGVFLLLTGNRLNHPRKEN